MTDAGLEATGEANDRAREREAAQTAFRAAGGAEGLAQRRAAAKGRLAASEAAVRREVGDAAARGELAVASTAQPAAVAPADPDALLRTGVRGVLGVLVLALLLLWARQRRSKAGL